MSLAQQGRQAGRREGASEEVSLPQLTVPGFQHRRLLGRLDALSGYRQTKRLRHRDDSLDDSGVLLALPDAADERTINLEHVERESL